MGPSRKRLEHSMIMAKVYAGCLDAEDDFKGYYKQWAHASSLIRQHLSNVTDKPLHGQSTKAIKIIGFYERSIAI